MHCVDGAVIVQPKWLWLHLIAALHGPHDSDAMRHGRCLRPHSDVMRHGSLLHAMCIHVAYDMLCGAVNKVYKSSSFAQLGHSCDQCQYSASAEVQLAWLSQL